MRWAVMVTALWLCALPSALAQNKDWLVLPTTTADGDTSWMQSTALAANRALRRQGVGVWLPDAAVSAFRERGSFAPPMPTEDEVAAWSARARNAFRTLALGDPSVARTELEGVQAYAERNLVTLNRDPKTASLVLDTCLYLARAYRDTGDLAQAELQVQACVRLAPSAAPNPRVHPPSIVESYDAAKKPSAIRAAAILIESEPLGCDVRVNGAFVGKTPVEVADLYPGAYQVQVECRTGELGRVHVVEVSRGTEGLFVIDRFERVVRSSPLLHLEFVEKPDTVELARYAREVARPLPASAVVLASIVKPEVLQLEVELAAQAESTFVRLPLRADRPNQDSMNLAVESLLAGRCADFTEDPPLELDCRTGRPIAPTLATASTQRVAPRGLFITGVSLASVGTASLAAGWSLFLVRRSAGDNWIDDANDLGLQARWLDLGTGVIVTGAVGGGLLTAAMPMVLPLRAKTPWWAWVNGGLGVAAAVGAIVSAATASPKPEESCEINGQEPSACVSRGRDTDRAILLGATAAPLLTMPLVYLLRRGERTAKAGVQPRVAVGRQGGFVGVSGSF